MRSESCRPIMYVLCGTPVDEFYDRFAIGVRDDGDGNGEISRR